MKSTRKNWVRSTWTAKVNYGKKSTVKVNHQSKSTLVNGQVNILVNDDISRCRGRWRGGWRQQMTWRMTWQMMSPRANVSREPLARAGAWQHVGCIGGTWRRVPVTPRILVARGGAWKVRWRRYFTERQIGEFTFWWCNLWSDWRSGSGGGGKAVVFDVLKSRWRQWCCSQQRL